MAIIRDTKAHACRPYSSSSTFSRTPDDRRRRRQATDHAPLALVRHVFYIQYWLFVGLRTGTVQARSACTAPVFSCCLVRCRVAPVVRCPSAHRTEHRVRPHTLACWSPDCRSIAGLVGTLERRPIITYANITLQATRDR